ncbi:hypothetical protein GOV12_00175, partial [Candidatus Pacearchaeota archaeon]|nr:hypothetical protein [Candidatus Pacearchaeota archaeon]
MSIETKKIADSLLEFYEIPKSKRKKVKQEVLKLVKRLDGQPSDIVYDQIVNLIERRIDSKSSKSFFQTGLDKPLNDGKGTLHDLIKAEESSEIIPKSPVNITELKSLPDYKRIIAEYSLKRAVSTKESKFKKKDGFWQSRSAKRVLHKSLDYLLEHNHQYEISR